MGGRVVSASEPNFSATNPTIATALPPPLCIFFLPSCLRLLQQYLDGCPFIMWLGSVRECSGRQETPFLHQMLSFLDFGTLRIYVSSATSVVDTHQNMFYIWESSWLNCLHPASVGGNIEVSCKGSKAKAQGEKSQTDSCGALASLCSILATIWGKH